MAQEGYKRQLNWGLDIYYDLYIILRMKQIGHINKEVYEKITCVIFSYLHRLRRMAAVRRNKVTQGY